MAKNYFGTNRHVTGVHPRFSPCKSGKYFGSLGGVGASGMSSNRLFSILVLNFLFPSSSYVLLGVKLLINWKKVLWWYLFTIFYWKLRFLNGKKACKLNFLSNHLSDLLRTMIPRFFSKLLESLAQISKNRCQITWLFRDNCFNIL